MKQEMMGWQWQWHQLDHVQIIAPPCRQNLITQFVTGFMLFPMSNRQYQSTEALEH